MACVVGAGRWDQGGRSASQMQSAPASRIGQKQHNASRPSVPAAAPSKQPAATEGLWDALCCFLSVTCLLSTIAGLSAWIIVYVAMKKAKLEILHSHLCAAYGQSSAEQFRQRYGVSIDPQDVMQIVFY